jgi:hypothetical protein
MVGVIARHSSVREHQPLGLDFYLQRLFDCAQRHGGQGCPCRRRLSSQPMVHFVYLAQDLGPVQRPHQHQGSHRRVVVLAIELLGIGQS